MKNKILMACILFLFLAKLQAQNSWTITGRVLDEASEPMVAVNVLLYAPDSTLIVGAVTNADGIFSFRTSHAGDCYMVVSFVSYSPQNFDLSLSENMRNIIHPDIRLQSSYTGLSEVEIVARKPPVIYKLDKKVIEASGYISSSGGTAADILAQTPSFRMDVEGEVTFRGSGNFKVYIDGKPAAMDARTALEQIPAGQIENIEVLSAPSAKNDADGSGGIINIKTKKQNVDGWSGTVNLMGSSVLSRNVDFLLALRQKNYRWQLSGEVSRRYVLSDFDRQKSITASDILTDNHSTGERERHTDVYYLRSGWEWLKENTTWSAATQVGYRDRWRGGWLHYEDSYQSLTTGEKTYASYNGFDFVHLYEWNLRQNFGVEHRFPDREGHTFTAEMYGFYQGNTMENFQTDLFYMDGSQAQGHRAWEAEYRLTGQINADYVHPLGDKGGKLETGYQLYTYTEDGDYNIDMYEPSENQFVGRDDLYNRYLFRRDIHALYAMFSGEHSHFNYQLGLRGEYVYWKLGNNREWAQHTRNKFDLFPSLHLGYTTKNDDRIRLAYSRRITQPDLFYMEPYVVYVDYYTAQCGNPKIRPEYTNSIELTYNKTIGKHSVSTTLFHRRRTDKIERIRVPYHTGVTLDSMSNVGNDYATGVELATDLQISKWWNMDINGSLFYYTIANEYRVDSDEESLNRQFAFNNNFDLARNTRLRLESYFVGPSVSTQGRVDEFFYFNLSVRQQMFNRRLSAILNIQDILSTAKYVDTKNGMNLASKTIVYPVSPLITLSLSYTFNNFKSQKKEEKVTHDLFEGTNR